MLGLPWYGMGSSDPGKCKGLAVCLGLLGLYSLLAASALGGVLHTDSIARPPLLAVGEGAGKRSLQSSSAVPCPECTGSHSRRLSRFTAADRAVVQSAVRKRKQKSASRGLRTELQPAARREWSLLSVFSQWANTDQWEGETESGTRMTVFDPTPSPLNTRVDHEEWRNPAGLYPRKMMMDITGRDKHVGGTTGGKKNDHDHQQQVGFTTSIFHFAAVAFTMTAVIGLCAHGEGREEKEKKKKRKKEEEKKKKEEKEEKKKKKKEEKVMEGGVDGGDVGCCGCAGDGGWGDGGDGGDGGGGGGDGGCGD